ncbi:hypothetical protein CEK29_19730 [Bordetella genomosp. 5]|uniref:helix-turn-helix domain-containing protein n=1 Tax=Bordetella genomosp. 5 TaxID=1395608 RepID=UPI000B9E10AB|nr:helix-turn-helix domain-containing protein [Bordetella genomosp. 5]OZI38739.1 hypothetical protein CEK29_19730 [Bordetella genomosp. 5]
MDLHRFESFEEFEAAVVDVDLKVRLLGPADGLWHIGHADVEGITVQVGAEAVANLCEASGSPTHLIFLISDGYPVPTWLNGEEFGPGKLGILAPNKEFVFRAAGPNGWVTIAVPLSSRLFSSADDVGHVLQRWCRSTDIVPCCPSAIQTLRVAALFGASREPLERALGRARIEAAIAGLVATRRPRPLTVGRPQVSPHELSAAAVQMFRAYDRGLSPREYRLVDLALRERARNDFFQRCFGLTPARYLKLRRLHAVHDALRASSNARNSVAELFEAEGYAYSAHSLARYRAIFGESPSDTRNAAHSAR